MFDLMRWRLTAWYVVASAAILLLVGLVIFVVESRAMSNQVDSSISATGDAVQAAMEAKLRVGSYSEPVLAAREAADTVATHQWLNAANVFIVLVDLEGNVIVNPEEIEAEAIDRTASMRRALDTGEAWETARVGNTRFRLKTFPLRDAQGNPVAMVQTGSSIDNFASQQRILAVVIAGSGLFGLALFGLFGYIVAGRLVRPVRLSYERQRQFVSQASHELRTPVAVIRTNAGILSRRGLNDVAIDDIEAEAAYMSRLLDDMLLLATSDRGQLAFKVAPVDVSSVVEDVGRAAAVLAEQAGLTFHSEITPDLKISADADRCRQLLLIFLDNALKFMPAGGEVSLSLAISGHDALIQVRDTGPGMDEDELERAAERFLKVDSNGAGPRGSGLGLSIAKELASGLGGTMSIESSRGHGTTVAVRFPLIGLAHRQETERVWFRSFWRP